MRAGSPLAMMAPSTITLMLCASSKTASISCSTRITAWSSPSYLSKPIITAASSAPVPASSSSRSRRSGFVAKVIAISSCRLSPWLKVRAASAARVSSRGVLPSQGHRPLQPAIGDDLAHREGRLPIRERGSEDIGCAQRARRRTHPGVGDDQQRPGIASDLDHRHLDARMHRADQEIDLLAVDELVGVLRRLGRFGFIISDGELDLAPALEGFMGVLPVVAPMTRSRAI